MKQLNLKNFEIIDPQFNENKVKKDIPISKLVVELSNYKAQSALKKLKKFDGFIISGDTEVYRCKKIFSKTSSEAKVKEYLTELSGRKHFVYGGITVISSKGQISKKLVKTEVLFNKISQDELNDMLLINEGIGKAGGMQFKDLLQSL